MATQRQKTQILDLSGGLINSTANPLNYPTTALIAGSNVEIGGNSMLSTRQGWAQNAAFMPSSTIKFLGQCRFPTNEKSYLVAQVTYSPVYGGYPRRDYISCVYDGIWWIWGGDTTTIGWEGADNPRGAYLHAYRFATGEWTELASQTGFDTGYRMVGHSGKLYLFPDSGTDFKIYDIASNTWSAGPVLPVEPTQASAYRAAGTDWVFFWIETPVTVYAYNVSSGAWTISDPWADVSLSTPLVYKVGSDDTLTLGPDWYGEVWGVWNPVANTWTHPETEQGTAYDPDYVASGNNIVVPTDDDWSFINEDRADYTYAHGSIGGGYSRPIWMVVDGTAGTHYTAISTSTTNSYATCADDGLEGSMCFQGGLIYRFGGRTTAGGEMISATGVMAVWNPASDTWTTDSQNFDTGAMGESCKLYACADNLPDTTQTWVEIYDLGAGAGGISCAVLNDRAVFTEGEAEVPLTWGGAMDATGGDWLVPKAVLGFQDGVNAYDVSSEVCDRDSDTVADVGGIQKWGYLAICCDVPLVEGFYIQMGTANTGTGLSTFTTDVETDDLDNISQRDLKGAISRWVQDASYSTKTLSGAAVNLGGSPNTVKCPCVAHGFEAGDSVAITGTTNYNGTYTLGSQSAGDTDNFVIEHAYTAETFSSPDEAHRTEPDNAGHFEGAAITLDGSAADLGGSPNTVKIPCSSAHGFVAGDKISIANTTNYNGTHTLPAQTAGDSTHFVITSAYNSETFASPDEARKRVTLGSGNTAADVVEGLWIQFASDTADILTIVDDGEEDNEVGLSSDHATANVTAIYALDVEDADAGCQINRTTDDYLDSFSPTAGTDNLACGGFHFRIRIPASQITYSGAQVRLTFQAETGLSKGFIIYHCSIAEAGTTTTAAATPTVVTFNSGSASATVATGSTVTSDAITFAVDESKSYLIILDCGGTHDGYSNTGGMALTKSVTGAQTYYIEYLNTASKTYDSYNQTSVASVWPVTRTLTAGYVPGLTKIEVKQIASIPSALYVGHTTGTATQDMTYATAIVSVAVDDTVAGSSTLYHAVSKDSRTTFYAFVSDAWRQIARNNTGTWQYNNSATTTPSWQAATINSIYGALEQAFAVGDNLMDSDALEAVTTAQWATWFDPYAVSQLDFAWSMQADGNDYPTLLKYTVSYTFGDMSTVEGYVSGEWSEGLGWTDGTVVSTIPLAQSGVITYDGTTPFEADYSTLSDVPGYWYRLVMGGTSAGTTISRILYKAPCQPLANIGDGQPDTVMAFLYWNGTDGSVSDYSSVVSDYVDKSEFSKADIPLTTADYLYVGYLTRFFELEVTPYTENNGATATLSAEYWNGESWTSLTITDGTSFDGATLATQGKITWAVPTDWRQTVPLTDTWYPRGYYIRLKASTTLSSTAAISELRVRGIPDSLKKHKEAVVVRDRLCLINRPDAPDQVDVSRALEEYGFSGTDSGGWRVGGMDGIAAAIQAWNTLLVGKTESWHMLTGSNPNDFGFSMVEAARRLPINSRSIVKASYESNDGLRHGLFFLNRFGAFAVSGVQADNTYGTLRAQDLSGALNWWDEDSSAYPILDLNNLHTICGAYWPVKNWIIWAVPMLLTSSQTEQTTNNRLVVYDLNVGAWLPPFDIALSSITTAYHYSDEAPGKLGALGLYGGNYSGQIMRLFDADDDNGTAISATARTGYLHCGHPGVEKNLWKLRLYGSTDSTSGITATLYADGEEVSRDTLKLRRIVSPAGKEFVKDFEDTNIPFDFLQILFEFTGPTSVYGAELEWTGLTATERQE
jgi:hypothetical protein